MEKMKVVSEKINTDADYFDDLGFNSLEFVELIMELETAFGIEISDDKAIPMLARHTWDPDPLDYHTKIWMMECHSHR